jgi:hypothetical protein
MGFDVYSTERGFVWDLVYIAQSVGSCGVGII